MKSAAVYTGGRGLMHGAGIAAVVGGTVLAVGWMFDPRRAAFAYLAAYAAVATTALGALLFLMIVHVMGATWPVALRRLVETIAGTLPLLAPLALPLLLGAGSLYVWARPEEVFDPHLRHLLEHKRAYLNVRAFTARTVLYVGVWSAVAALLRRWSLAQDDGANPAAARWSRRLSAGGLPLVALTMTFAAIDWLMSLAPDWYSTLYGIYVFSGGFLSALSAITLLAYAMRREGLIDLGRAHFYALGRLLLAFTIFWAYAAYFQFFHIWIANRPEEVGWYLSRARGSWGSVSVALAVVRFALPFFVLLSYALKQRAGALAVVSAWHLAGHALDLHWQVAPAAQPAGFRLHVLDAAAWLAVGGAAVAYGTWLLRGRAVVPHHDPALERALRYQSA